FFFSSRRRHTRFSRDWSSDVCSSDLPSAVASSCVEPTPTPDTCNLIEFWFAGIVTVAGVVHTSVATQRKLTTTGSAPTLTTPLRSEERRVGKEYRAPRRPQQ